MSPSRAPANAAAIDDERSAGEARPALTAPPGWSSGGGPGYALYADAESDQRLGFAFSVARGLESRPRALEFRWLYDDQGSRIFDRITEQPEYYQTRTEDAILAAHADRIRALVGPAALVELGSGSSQKTRRLLDAFTRRAPGDAPGYLPRYVPIDVSAGALGPACRALAAAYPGLAIEGIAASYDRGLEVARALSPLCLVFLGSSIGNFERAECDRFLGMVASRLSPGDHFLIGLDQIKSPTRLEAAYNDAAGWSAAFTRNLFERMNGELGSALDCDTIEHIAFYDEWREQIEIYARFGKEAELDLKSAGRTFRLGPGELVRTEISRKFRPAAFADHACRFGFEPVQVFEDAESLFGVVLLRRGRAGSARPPRSAEAALASLLGEVRRRTLEIVAPLSDADLGRQHSPLMSPLVWDLAHVAAYEELWLDRRLCRGESERAAGEGLPQHLDALLNPRPTRGQLPLPDRAAALTQLGETRLRSLAALADHPLDDRDPLAACAHRMVAQHEAQHQETMLAALQLRADLVYQPSFADDTTLAAPLLGDPRLCSETRLCPAGPFSMGTDDRHFAYDNERPRHEVTLPAFRIDAAPVTSGQWLRFIADGGYRRPELWCDEGWSWRRSIDAQCPDHWSLRDGAWQERRFGTVAPVDPDCPVVHVSWYEADAFARWAHKRLPTEAEWEKAAAWDPTIQRPRRYPWGDEEALGEPCNLGQRRLGPAPIGAFPSGRSFYGCHQMLGDVWEWTSSPLTPYPGFRAFPYREYSEVFFGQRHRVLRGGSWATLPVVARVTFRNWDFPERRQIFAGLRCCQDA